MVVIGEGAEKGVELMMGAMEDFMEQPMILIMIIIHEPMGTMEEEEEGEGIREDTRMRIEDQVVVVVVSMVGEEGGVFNTSTATIINNIHLVITDDICMYD